MDQEKFILASQEGHLDQIRTMSNISEVGEDMYGRTMLHYACWNGHLEIVNFLLENSVTNQITQDNFGFTPLHLVHFEHKDYLPGFQKVYANEYARNLKESYFPTDVAIGKFRFRHTSIKNKLKITKLLISCGADVNARNQFNCTPLHYAAANGVVAVLCYLH
jgi:ankyrin repeat protein